MQGRRLFQVVKDSKDAIASSTVHKNAMHVNGNISGSSIGKTAKDLRNPELLYDLKLLSNIMEMFPDVCPDYIKSISAGMLNNYASIDFIVNTILSNTDNPKRKREPSIGDRKLDEEEQLLVLQEILPNANPEFLSSKIKEFDKKDEELKMFVAELLESTQYPTMAEYKKEQQLSAQIKQYTTEFNVESFLQAIPDPEAFFNNTSRKSITWLSPSWEYTLQFLKNEYNLIPVQTIRNVLNQHGSNLTEKVKHLGAIMKSGKGLIKCKRKPSFVVKPVDNIPLLQEIAFLSHRQEILSFMEERRKAATDQKEQAKRDNLLQTCNCCYDSEVMPQHMYRCENGCVFCRDCIKRSAELIFAEAKIDFPCLAQCTSHFSLKTVQMVTSGKLFSKIAQRKQLQEVKAAGIEDLEACPYCDFATIPAPGDKIFRCLNEECMKETCRLCKEPSHVPLRCEELEKDEDVQRRIFIENKMSEALIRNCYKCNAKFIKLDGCNKISCSCGALMCYICGKSVKDYGHFNGQGGDRFDLCPLFSDIHAVHEKAVLTSAAAAKVELGVNGARDKLKVDPAADIKQHYKVMKEKYPQYVPPGMQYAQPNDERHRHN